MIVQVQTLNKIYLFSLFTLLFYNCIGMKKENNDINFIVDHYISYYSSQNKKFDSQKKYLLIGIKKGINDNQNKIISLSDGCYNCPGSIKDTDTFIQYKGYKVIIVSDNIECTNFALKHFKNTTQSTKFSVEPFDSNVMYDFPRYWEIEYNNQNKIISICMGNSTDKIKKILGFDNVIFPKNCST